MIFYENAVAHLNYLKREKSRLISIMRDLPSEKLVKKISGGKKYYYTEKNGKKISLQKNVEMLQQLLERERIEKNITTVEENISLLTKVVERYQPLMADEIVWRSMHAKQNMYRPEDLKHLYKGIFYRSKSELAIAMMLTSYGIEFKYEVAVETGGRHIYPDFAVKRKSDGGLILWEHFGLVGNPQYRESMFRKLADYHESGYNLWEGLIATFDKEDGSVNGDIIEKIIKVYLL